MPIVITPLLYLPYSQCYFSLAFKRRPANAVTSSGRLTPNLIRQAWG